MKFPFFNFEEWYHSSGDSSRMTDMNCEMCYTQRTSVIGATDQAGDAFHVCMRCALILHLHSKQMEQIKCTKSWLDTSIKDGANRKLKINRLKRKGTDERR